MWWMKMWLMKCPFKQWNTSNLAQLTNNAELELKVSSKLCYSANWNRNSEIMKMCIIHLCCKSQNIEYNTSPLCKLLVLTSVSYTVPAIVTKGLNWQSSPCPFQQYHSHTAALYSFQLLEERNKGAMLSWILLLW